MSGPESDKFCAVKAYLGPVLEVTSHMPHAWSSKPSKVARFPIRMYYEDERVVCMSVDKESMVIIDDVRKISQKSWKGQREGKSMSEKKKFTHA
jgi:hypothetical protein